MNIFKSYNPAYTLDMWVRERECQKDVPSLKPYDKKVRSSQLKYIRDLKRATREAYRKKIDGITKKHWELDARIAACDYKLKFLREFFRLDISTIYAGKRYFVGNASWDDKDNSVICYTQHYSDYFALSLSSATLDKVFDRYKHRKDIWRNNIVELCDGVSINYKGQFIIAEGSGWITSTGSGITMVIKKDVYAKMMASLLGS